MLYGLLATSLLVPTFLGSAIKASADTVTQDVKTTAVATPTQHVLTHSQDSSKGLSESKIKQIDPYISVANNQYQLSEKAFDVFSQQELQVIQNTIKEANTNIAQQHLKIDAQTKEAISPIQSKAAWDSHYTTANFWWGTRYYFTSNEAVAQMQHELTGGAIAWGIAGAVGSIVAEVPLHG